jgi:4-oxalocrotonate tautomerase
LQKLTISVRRIGSRKRELSEAIVKNVMEITKVGSDAVSVAIEEVKPADWTENVYKPDILNGPGKLYKQPGYNPT